MLAELLIALQLGHVSGNNEMKTWRDLAQIFAIVGHLFFRTL